MAGISAFYYIGGAGGFMGSDGLNGKHIEIEVWEADRRTLVANYLSNYYKPMYKDLKSFVPHGPDDKEQARIALILFASNVFKDCPSYKKVKVECKGINYIDFSAKLNVPEHFYDLLEESRQIELNDEVNIYFAPLMSPDLKQINKKDGN